MKNKGSIFKLGATVKAAGSGQWKTSCSLSCSLPQTLEFPWLVPAAGKAEWSWLGEVRVGNVSISGEQGFTSGLYTCFPLKNTRAPISTPFLWVFFRLAPKEACLGDCTPCAQLRVVVKPPLFPAQLRAFAPLGCD